MFFGPRKWIAISPVNLLRFSEPHDLQGMGSPLIDVMHLRVPEGVTKSFHEKAGASQDGFDFS
jgi:hypothetical protein